MSFNTLPSKKYDSLEMDEKLNNACLIGKQKTEFTESHQLAWSLYK
jgi:hypothetical protein